MELLKRNYTDANTVTSVHTKKIKTMKLLNKYLGE